jgi:hypothetical protein
VLRNVGGAQFSWPHEKLLILPGQVPIQILALASLLLNLQLS